MKQIRKRLTYANVMSSIAVFLLLGGATAIAAKKIGSSQLKANSVTTGKIKKNAVTTSKIKNNAVNGAKVNESTLGQVPSAALAESANHVNGQTANKIFKTLTEGQSGVAVGTVAGFGITASCSVNDADVTITAPAGQGTVLTSGGNGDGGSNNTFDYDSDAGGGSTIQIDTRVGGGADVTYGISSVTGATSGGTTISGVIGYDWDTFGDSPRGTCIVYGHLLAG